MQTSKRMKNWYESSGEIGDSGQVKSNKKLYYTPLLVVSIIKIICMHIG